MRDGLTRTTMLARVLAMLLGSACCGGALAQLTARTQADRSKLMPCASGRSAPQLTVHVCRRM